MTPTGSRSRMPRYSAIVVFAGMLLATQPVLASDVADAVMHGDLAALTTLLNQGADVNEAQIDGTTALHWAVYYDDVDVARQLIEAGAEVEAGTRDGITPLHLAAQYGGTGMIELLLDSGADAAATGPNGETMVMLAARRGDADSIRVLTAAGADVNARESLRGTTALMWAAEQRHPEAVRALLDAGADVAATSGGAGLPRVYLAQPVNVRNVELAQARRRAVALGEEVSEAPGRSGQSTPEAEAEAAALLGEAPAAAERPARNENAAAANPNNPATTDAPVAGLVGAGGGGLTALIFAARENDIATARLLVDAGADVNQVTNYGWSPLLTAVNNRNYQLARFLIEAGADVNIANGGGMTPLYLATDNRNIEGGDYPVPLPDMDHLELIRLLLERGADVNAQVSSNTENRTIFTMQWFFEPGATAFVRAAQSGDTTLMRLLLDYGADPMIPTDFNDTALTAAAGIGWVDGVTFEWSSEETTEAVRMLLELGLDPNARNNDGRTPLMGAAHKGRNDIVRLLVDNGAQLDARDYGSRDTEDLGSVVAGHTWQVLDYAEGLVRVGVQSALPRPETAALIREMLAERGLPVPPADRTIESICVVEICEGDLPDDAAGID